MWGKQRKCLPCFYCFLAVWPIQEAQCLARWTSMAVFLLVLNVSTLLCRLLQRVDTSHCSRGGVCFSSPPVSTGELSLMLPVKVWVQILSEMHLGDVLCWNISLAWMEGRGCGVLKISPISCNNWFFLWGLFSEALQDRPCIASELWKDWGAVKSYCERE